MSSTNRTLADDILCLIELNRTTINGLDCGEIVFKAHRGRLVEVVTSEALRLSAGNSLHSLELKVDES
jgi:hypothetical protein